MPDFQLPLSGNVTQTISPWTAFFSPMGNQASLISINLGTSSNPPVEAQVLSDVASYGKQLGRIGDAFGVLLAHFKPARPLTPVEDKAIRDLTRMLDEIAHVKDRHGSKASVSP
ncbi:MAG: hypothetical protein P4L71_16205 [Acetobacteraceae bacterium]|nr:hypothetical protein [Acetobacteraceae bacterium]